MAEYFFAEKLSDLQLASPLVPLDLASLVGRTQGKEFCSVVYSACQRPTKEVMEEIRANEQLALKN